MVNETLSVAEEQQFELLIDALVNNEYGMCDNFFTPEEINGLRENLQTYHQDGLMYPAGVGRNFDYQKNAEIRGDVIYWINENSDNPLEVLFIAKIKRFITYLNTTCYTGINDFEFHYAYYEQNSFYKRHLDQFKSDRGRRFSMVLYLNENWQQEDGGSLSLYIGDETLSVYPMGGRLVFFKSDETEHEVHAAPNRPRISIAGWLKVKK